MNQLKTRLQALSLLDRALTAMSDEELAALVASLPDDHRTALDKLCGARDDEGFTDPAARTLAIRSTAARGRMNGGLEQITTILADPCLAECIEGLGEHADNPTEEQLKEVTPGLVETFGVGTVRLMIAGSIAGEATASAMLIRLLKFDETFALPAEERPETVVLVPAGPGDEVRAKRKALKEAKKAGSRARREQQLRAKNRV
ncbi:MAG: hypothetical protein ABIR68_04895 [Ilumatobacteraceae bacterium]